MLFEIIARRTRRRIQSFAFLSRAKAFAAKVYVMEPNYTNSFARTHCPDCDAPAIDLANLLHSPRVDYFRCNECGCWWFLPKGQDGPATRGVFGKADAAAGEAAKKAG